MVSIKFRIILLSIQLPLADAGGREKEREREREECLMHEMIKNIVKMVSWMC